MAVGAFFCCAAALLTFADLVGAAVVFFVVEVEVFSVVAAVFTLEAVEPPVLVWAKPVPANANSAARLSTKLRIRAPVLLYFCHNTHIRDPFSTQSLIPGPD